MARRLFRYLIRGYQLFISPILPGKCRYYPTCSNYAMIQFEKRSLLPALALTVVRILRCNQLFEGGFDYPVMDFKQCKNPLAPHKTEKKRILYWLLPYKGNKVKIIKGFEETR